ncbi:MAG: IS5 family transposase [Gammaproteobacteria bacterium]|nr:MAG: IS5 family transposase [Gammaproteobacteria bacterium]
MSQMSFGDAEYAGKRKRTRREVFLAEMEQVVPWLALESLIEPVYPKAGRGRHPYALQTMLRIHLMQNWFGFSDPAMEEALYEIAPVRQFARLSLTRAIPDETTMLHFRHLLGEHDLAPKILQRVNAHLCDHGLLLKRGSMVDATIIAAPSSTKNADGARDPDMHQTKKGNQYYFGMKAHIGVDVESGLVHTVTTTAANVADVTQIEALLHGQERSVHADAGYTGAAKRVKRKRIHWHIAAKRGAIKAMKRSRLKRAIEELETLKARIRARVEHPFRVVKRQFGYVKVRFRGLAKNHAQILTLFALSNLWMARKRLLAMTGSLRPQFANGAG